MPAKSKILFAIEKCEEELNGQNRYSWLPTTISRLKDMLLVLDEGKLDSSERAKSIIGLGKIVCDNYDFMQSEMGKAVAAAMEEYKK